jgi:hypothetical protein
MNKATEQWIGGTFQCRACSERVEHVENDFLCTPCHQLRRLFPTGETNRRRRGHAFLTKQLLRSIPRLYATEEIECDGKALLAHYFVGGCDWYVAELDPETGDAFGLADLGCAEWGYFNLVELEATVMHGWLVVERDLDFVPRTAQQLGLA